MRTPDLRSWVFLLFVFSLLGTTAELLMLDHRDSFAKLIPFGVFAIGLVATAFVAVRTTPLTLNVFRAVMVVFVATGAVGLYFHYRGNVEFELEMSPALRGWALIRGALSGATPTLAPGAMSQIGLLGFLFTWRHPALTARSAASRQQSEITV